MGGGKLRIPGGGGKISIGGNKMPPAKTPIQQARELLGKVNAFVALARQARMSANDWCLVYRAGLKSGP